MYRLLLACLTVASSHVWCALPPVPAQFTATDSAGRIYIAGSVSGQVADASSGALQAAYSPGSCIAMGFHVSYTIPCQDGFIMRIDPTGTQVEAASYLGGAGMEDVRALHITADGSVYVALYSASKRIDSLGLTTDDNLLGSLVLKLNPDLTGAVTVLRLSAGYIQEVAVLADQSIAFSALTCGQDGCLPSVGVYTSDGKKVWEKNLSNTPFYTQLIAASAGYPYLWAATTEFENNTSIPVLTRLRLSDGLGLMRVQLTGAGYNVTGLGATPDGGVVAVTLPSSGGFAFTSVNPDGSRGRARVFNGALQRIEVDSAGVVHAIGPAATELPTPAQSLRRCAASPNDSFSLGWNAATGVLTYATFLDGGLSSMAVRGGQLVLARTIYGPDGASSEVQVLNPFEFPEQPPCLNPQIDNFGGPVSFNLNAGKQVAPGEFLWVYGSGIGPDEDVRIDMNGIRGQAPRELAGSRVLFNNQPAAILAVASSRVLVQAPYALAGQPQATVRVERDGVATNDIALEVKDSVPAAIPGFNGAVYNADWTLNTETNAAQPGEVVSIFVSGAGKLEGITDDAAAVPSPAPALAAPVTAIIAGSGGQAVTFAGGVAGQLPGLVQVNVRIGYDFAFHGRLQLELWFGPVGTGTGTMALVELFVR